MTRKSPQKKVLEMAPCLVSEGEDPHGHSGKQISWLSIDTADIVQYLFQTVNPGVGPHKETAFCYILLFNASICATEGEQ